MRRISALICAMLVAAFATHTMALTLPPIVGDHMVLQQNTKANVWGWAKVGSTVKVTNSWNKEKVTATASANGKWVAALSTPAGSYEPQTITIEADGQKVTLTDILIGEVWLASGQSNMEMPLKGFPAQPVEEAGEEIAFANDLQNHIHMATVVRNPKDEPADTVNGSWKSCNPVDAPAFSAVGYFFAKALDRLLHVPVGIIHTSWGGTAVECWMTKETAAKCDTTITAQMRKNGQPIAQCFYGMIHPFLDYTLRGFLWNQGETNAMYNDRQYAEHFALMLAEWRKAFNQGNLPMYCVEIPGFIYDGADKLMAPRLREQQWRGCELAGNAECVSIIDLIHPWQLQEIHGSQKKMVGYRLAWMAADRTYGIKGMPAKYPMFEKVDYQGNKAIVTIKNAEPSLCSVGTEGDVFSSFVDFEVAGADKKFYPAKASIDGWDSNRFVVVSDKVSEVKAVRYAFKNWVLGKVQSTTGLPLVPFRTDDW